MSPVWEKLNEDLKRAAKLAPMSELLVLEISIQIQQGEELGRIADALETLRNHGLPVEVI